MQKYLAIVMLLLTTACTTLTRQEQNELRNLKAQGITVDRPVGNYERPASPGAAGALNLLPGIGNFYLASGNGGDSSHWLYGCLNLITWPFSILWGVPEAAVDANRINERELIYYYKYERQGQKELAKNGKTLNDY